MSVVAAVSQMKPFPAQDAAAAGTGPAHAVPAATNAARNMTNTGRCQGSAQQRRRAAGTVGDTIGTPERRRGAGGPKVGNARVQLGGRRDLFLIHASNGQTLTPRPESSTMESALSILFLGHPPAAAAVLAQALQSAGFTVAARHADSAVTLRAELLHAAPDLIFADDPVADCPGLTALALAQELCPQTPLLFVAAALDEARVLEVLRSGAADCVRWDHLDQLGPAVRRARRAAVAEAERRHAAAALRESEARFRTLAETSPAIIFVHQEGKFRYANPAAETILGYRRAELLALNFWDVVQPEFRDVVRARGLQRQQGHAVPTRYEFPILTKAGATRWLECSSGRTEFNGQPAVLGTAFDVTERKRLEKDLLEISNREQRRIGQDLHDGLGQHLTGIAFLAKALEQKLGAGDHPAAGDAAKIVGLVVQALSQTRNLARGLYPVELESSGIVAALREQVESVAKLFNVRCHFECDRPFAFPDPHSAVHLYRIVQEAMNNAIKHGHARQIWVRLEVAGERVTLTVRDDGTGFTAPPADGQGMGLRIMNYRANRIGARLELQTTPAGGTCVLCAFPRVPGALLTKAV